MSSGKGFQTRSIHSGELPDPVTGAHGGPIYQNTTFQMRDWQHFDDFWAGEPESFGYSRDHNPTVYHLEQKIAELEGAEGAVGTASGMGAIASTVLALAAGGHVVAADQVYNTANKLFTEDLPSHGISFSRVDITDLDAVEAAFKSDTRVLYTEVFSNPSLIVADLPALAGIAHQHGALVVIDNTFLTPALFRPLEHGADVVVHSATKYLAGHGAVLGGLIVSNQELTAKLRKKVNRLGPTLSALSAWLIMMGMRTLALRMERHSRNAQAVAEFFSIHPMVEQIHYPGLSSDPGHTLAKRLLPNARMFSGMMSVRLQGGAANIPAFAEALELVTFATSLGDTASLCWPIFQTDLVRFSIGLEDEADIIYDLEQALAAIG